VLLTAYVATLLWMRQMIAGKPTARFLTAPQIPGSVPPVEAVVPLQAVQTDGRGART
jgi:hypothetical protein